MSLLNPGDDYSKASDFDEYQSAKKELDRIFGSVVQMEDELRHRYGVNWETEFDLHIQAKLQEERLTHRLSPYQVCIDFSRT